MLRIALLFCLAVVPPSLAAGLTDSIDLSDPAAVAAHHFTALGKVESTMSGDKVGGHDCRRVAHVIEPNASAAYQLKIEPEKPITLEIEEIDNRDNDLRAYRIFIDDAPVAFRTWQSCGAGPVHYFINVPPRKAATMTVRLANESTSPARITRLWAFSDFDQYFHQGGMEVPYHLAPTIRLTRDFDADLARLKQISQSLGKHPNVLPAWTTWVAYAKLPDERVHDRIDYALRLAEASGIPVQIAFDTWWASTPNGPDGKGGHWTDEQYQQVVWDATNKKMRLSVPNQWSNTPWLTVNHPDLNAFKVQRLTSALAYLRNLLPEKRNLILAINLDNEPVYWASGNAGNGHDLLQADFNPHTINAAKRDGITLDPADGLSDGERRWLFSNLLNYTRMIARAASDALGRDASIVTTAGAAPASDLLRNNLYTQAMMANPMLQYPMFDAAYPFWEWAAPAEARVGGEWNDNSLAEQQAVMHQIALGRNAAVNAECSKDVRNMRGVRIGYALGQRYYALYNYPLDKMDVASAELLDVAKPFPSFVHQKTLLEHDFQGERWKEIVATQSGLTVDRLSNSTALAVQAATKDRPGVLSYRLHAPADGFDSLAVELSGRAFDYKKENADVAIRVMVGDQEAGRLAGVHDLNAVYRIDLTQFAKGRRELDVRIELIATGLEQLGWCNLWHVRFTTGWPESLTRDIPPPEESLALSRQRSLLVSWRRDAELAIQQSPSDVASAAYAKGDYAAAYKIANQSACTTLPATFFIKQSGPLSPYPIRAEVDQSISIELRAVSADGIRLTASGAAHLIANVAPGKRFTLRKTDGEIVIQPDEKGDLISTPAGELRFDVSP